VRVSGGRVHIDGVWKKFRRGERHDSLRDFIPAIGRALTRRPKSEALDQDQFWALQDVSFDVEPGQALGIIGPNGAGKSTILKILTKLLQPTHGVAEVRGRVGALLEIGGSLHPDLTGRENVFLQGSIMGMRRAEILEKFDEIVEFAGIPEFIDTPVKRYSSGMHARLGFAVAAHLETDVLIIDEVLAVGDSAFQRKAFERMEMMVKSGVPTIIVSHQLERVAALCQHAVLLSKGRVAFQGEPTQCISVYAKLQSATLATGDETDGIMLESIEVTTPVPVASGEPVEVVIRGTASARRHHQVVVLRVRSLQTGQMMYAISNQTRGVDLPDGPFELSTRLAMNVAEGMYSIESIVGQSTSDRDVRNGPATLVHVTGGPPFWGGVQMGATMRVRATSGTPA
jgi:ABC-type polysaccharide/polyol phosphate transport system ATPase subunit